jgi:hypothetical protein
MMRWTILQTDGRYDLYDVDLPEIPDHDDVTQVLRETVAVETLDERDIMLTYCGWLGKPIDTIHVRETGSDERIWTLVRA